MNKKIIATISAVTLSSLYFIKPFENKLNYENFKKIPGVEQVIFQNPSDIIYIPFAHSNQMSPHSPMSERTTPSIELICNTLYDKYKVRSLILEGLVEEQVDNYNKNKSINLKSRNISKDGVGDDYILSRILSNRNWSLYTGDVEVTVWKELELLEAPIRDLHAKYISEVYRIADNVNKRIKSEDSRKYLIANAQNEVFQTQTQLQNLIDEYCTPEVLQKLYDIKITQRNNKVVESVKSIPKPVIIIYGSNHKKDLFERLNSQGLTTTTIIPKGHSEVLEASFETLRKEYLLPGVRLD
jgi:hypothetical protein